MTNQEFEGSFNNLVDKLDLFWKDIKKRKGILKTMRDLISSYLEGDDENG